MFQYPLINSLLCATLFSSSLWAQTFQSGSKKTQLLELYSSQGCSSCPPAERWVSKQLQHPALWSEFIPIVFHVDYWDYLGWKDPFSDKQFSQRQRRYHAQGAINSVYTPGIIYDGEEWRGWYKGSSLTRNNNNAGILSAEITQNQLQVNYKINNPLYLNVVLLGFNIKTDVQGGENVGQVFKDNFVVLKMKTIFSNNGKWDFTFNTRSKFHAERYAIAIWVNSPQNLTPLQVTGGWLKAE